MGYRDGKEAMNIWMNQQTKREAKSISAMNGESLARFIERAVAKLIKEEKKKMELDK